MEKWRRYVRGGSISNMMRLLPAEETRREPRLARRLLVAGIVFAVAAALATATMRFFGG